VKLRALFIGFGLLSLAACGRQDAIPTETQSSAAPIVLNRGSGGEPDTLDPHRNEENSGAEILRDLFEGLTTEDVEARIVPGTAESWTISEDGRVYTFSIRSGARWSNGDPVAAEDFVAGLRRTVAPATASTYAQILYPIENAEAIVNGKLPPTPSTPARWRSGSRRRHPTSWICSVTRRPIPCTAQASPSTVRSSHDPATWSPTAPTD